MPLFASLPRSEPDLWALSYATSFQHALSPCDGGSGPDWFGLGGSAAAVVVNYLRWDVCIFAHGNSCNILYIRVFPSGVLYVILLYIMSVCSVLCSEGECAFLFFILFGVCVCVHF